MAIEFFTGFEGCESTNDVQSILGVSSGSPPTYAATGGFNNGKSIYLPSSGYFAYKPCAAAKTKATGSHIRGATGVNNTHQNYALFQFVGPDIRILFWSTGIHIYRAGTQIATSGVFLTTALHHIEAKVYSHVSAGTVQIKIDGALVLDLSGLNTGGGDITGVQWGAPAKLYRDNLYISDDFEGELISVLCRPSSDAAVQFTPSTGTDNYALVDDTGQDGDTTYVQSSTVGHIDLYTYEDVPSGYLVKAVSLVTVAKKDDAGVRTLQPVARQDSTNYDVGSEITLTTGYPAVAGAGAITTLGVAPDATAWDRAKFNAIEWGFEVAS